MASHYSDYLLQAFMETEMSGVQYFQRAALIVLVVTSSIASSVSLKPAHAQNEQPPTAEDLIKRAQEAAKPSTNYNPVLSRLFYRAAELDREMPVYQRQEIVVTAEEALANKIGVAKFRAISAFYYPKDLGYVVCGMGRYYRSGKEMNGVFIYSDLYGGIRITDAGENIQRAYDCQSIANFRLR